MGFALRFKGLAVLRDPLCGVRFTNSLPQGFFRDGGDVHAVALGGRHQIGIKG